MFRLSFFNSRFSLSLDIGRRHFWCLWCWGELATYNNISTYGEFRFILELERVHWRRLVRQFWGNNGRFKSVWECRFIFPLIAHFKRCRWVFANLFTLATCTKSADLRSVCCSKEPWIWSDNFLWFIQLHIRIQFRMNLPLQLPSVLHQGFYQHQTDHP